MIKNSLILSVIFLLLAPAVNAQNEKLQTVFIYNFTKHIEWPPEYSSGDFVIGVLGNSPIIEEIEKLAKSRKIGNQKIVVNKYRTIDDIGQCNIIFIPKSKSGEIGSVLSKIKNNSTLVITEKDGMAVAGAAINFVIKDGKQKFELKKSNATKYGLKVSSDLERLGIVVK